MDDPLEQLMQDGLNAAKIKYIRDGTKGQHGVTKHLDFYLPEYDVYIEVCAYHTPRKVEQCSRADNVILLQGKKAVKLFAWRLVNMQKPSQPTPKQ